MSELNFTTIDMINNLAEEQQLLSIRKRKEVEVSSNAAQTVPLSDEQSLPHSLDATTSTSTSLESAMPTLSDRKRASQTESISTVS